MRNGTFNCTLSTKKPVKALRYCNDSLTRGTEAKRPPLPRSLRLGTRNWSNSDWEEPLEVGRNLWRSQAQPPAQSRSTPSVSGLCPAQLWTPPVQGEAFPGPALVVYHPIVKIFSYLVRVSHPVVCAHRLCLALGSSTCELSAEMNTAECKPPDSEKQLWIK